MKYKLETLDLHGIYHKEAEILIDHFIIDNKDNFPVEIITGNSIRMQEILKKIVELHGLSMRVKSYVNLGAFIIS